MRSLKEFLWTLVHFGPISTLLLVKTITLSTIYCSLMWWPPHESIGGMVCLTSFLVASGMVLYHFFAAIQHGPGYLPYKWKPRDESAMTKLQFCHVCQGYKAPRAHHCRKCGRCVMKLDHHCPWINSCVGHMNQANFIMFLISAVWGCTHGTIILTCSVYRAIYRNQYYYDPQNEYPIVYLGLYGFLWCLFSLGCAFGVVLGVGVLLVYQIKIVVRNQTTIEEWIMEKADFRRKRYNDEPFVYPYNLGWKTNIRLVLNLRLLPVGNGIDWPLLPGCTQYDLTIEQIEQKEEKRKRMKEYVITEDYAGSWCPVSHGCGVFCHPPFSDESRIPLQKEDRILVTRWKKHWLYGEKIMEDEGEGDNEDTETELPRGKERIKGWFPKRCSMEVMNAVPNDSEHFECYVRSREDTTSSTVSKKTN